MLDNHGRLRDLSEHVLDLAGVTLLPASIEQLRSLDPTRLPEVAGTPRLGTCAGGVGKIIGVGLNYRDHAAESNMAIPKEPPLFLKPPSAYCPNNRTTLFDALRGCGIAHGA
jgi:2-keto-4-pentenoate hydratase/2-oxohepta-3-ene-1,7-dioic acid hydratase in catechol pathway